MAHDKVPRSRGRIADRFQFMRRAAGQAAPWNTPTAAHIDAIYRAIEALYIDLHMNRVTSITNRRRRSTLVREALEVTRLLIERGAWFDIFIAVGLRDAALVERCLRDDPEALDHRIWHGKYRAVHNGKRAATREEIGDHRGDVYRWVFDHNASALDDGQGPRLRRYRRTADAACVTHTATARRLCGSRSCSRGGYRRLASERHGESHARSDAADR